MESSNNNVDWSCLNVIPSKSIQEWTKDDVSGLKFDSFDDAAKFYRTYALAIGFGIRIHDIKHGHGVCVLCKWVCCRQGFRRQKHLDREDRKREPRALTRVGCKALFRIKFDHISGQYIAMDFFPEHNHALASAQEVQFLHSYRSVKASDKSQIMGLREVGVKVSQIMDCMVNEAGGYEHVGFTTKDLYNFIESCHADEIMDTDSEATLTYLSVKAEQDENFFCRYAVDNKNRLSHLFWTDSISRKDYSCFGDVIAFDTTYKTNKYKMPFVIIVGTNHHGSTVVFGCALLPNEKIETYIWVLQMFLASMENKKPQAVLTDGDKSMREAIEVIFPGVIHRNCCWHLRRNAQTNVRDDRFQKVFEDLMIRIDGIAEFELTWSNMVQDFGLQNHEWVSSMYNKRDRWAEAFFKGNFLAGMRSTQRCEGMNAYLKRFLQSQMKLVEFVRQYDRGLRRIRHTEAENDFTSFHTEPVLRTHMKHIEKHASNVYTRNKFFEVRDEIMEEVNYNVTSIDSHGDNCIYKISRAFANNSARTMTYQQTNQILLCSCQMVESVGIPCRHIFNVMQYRGITIIPSNCIVKRWSKEAKDYSQIIQTLNNKGSDINSIVRFGSLNGLCSRLCYRASKTSKAYNEVRKKIDNLLFEVDEMLKVENESIGSLNDEMKKRKIEDPVIVRTKGCAGPSTSNAKEARRCGHCRNVGHDRRTCPQRVIQIETGAEASDGTDGTI